MSFSYDTKTALCSVIIKNACCKKAFLYGMFYACADYERKQINFSVDHEKSANLCATMIRSVFSADGRFIDNEKHSRSGHPIIGYKLVFPENSDVEKICKEFQGFEYNLTDDLLKCENCTRTFLRGLFLSVGTISNPTSGYHLEFAVSDSVRCHILCDFLCDNGFPAKITVRRGVCAVYIKESEVIEDFFTFIGAQQVALAIMDVKIMRDIRNNENRRNNCDTANIYKSTGAALVQLHAIERLNEENMIHLLPKELVETANLRLNNPEISMSELAALHEPPITKSGVSHRLTKIVNFYEKYKKEQNKSTKN